MVRSISQVWFWGITLAACFNLSELFSRRGGDDASPRGIEWSWLPEAVVSLPSPPSSSSRSPFQYWRNDHNVVHVIQTRIMQYQPDLLHLGKARLGLFEAFCLRTMVMQSSQQFLWIIRAGKGRRYYAGR
jgi:hypothetical protein